MTARDWDRFWDPIWDAVFPPEYFDRMQRLELAITGDGKPRVDRAHGTLATEALPALDLTQIAATEGSGYDTAHDQVQYVAGAYVPGGADVAIADGGTGASTASGARTNLGLVIGTDVPPVASPTFTGTITSGGASTDETIVRGHDRHKSAAPTIAVGAALGTGGSVGATVVGTDQHMTVTLTAGTTSLTTGVAATVTFATARPNTQYTQQLGKQWFNARTNAVQAGFEAQTTTTFTIVFNIAPSSGFIYIYHVDLFEWTN